MRILWLSNVLFPEACEALNTPAPVVGGWMYAAAKALLEANPAIELAVVANYAGNQLQELKGEKINYYLVPFKGSNQIYNKNIENYYRGIKDSFKPDLVHIHGTEYPNTLAYIRANRAVNVLVSIQGMVSVYANYYMGGIASNKLSKTFRDILRNDSLQKQQRAMMHRGNYERELITQTSYHVGRTSWDKSNLWAINPNSEYFFCNETLRDGFYTAQWRVQECERHTIFLSQAHYPIKGLHKIIESLPIILRQYPATKVLVAGNDFVNVPWFRKNGYAAYIQKLLAKHKLTNKVQFLGVLNETEMVHQYQKAHVFVCPSAIENSPNSVGEAQLVGTPCVASYVGGTMDMITEGETGFLYRFEETALLAQRVCEIFGSDELATKLSKNGRKVAADRHNKVTNAKRLNAVYEDVLGRLTTDNRQRKSM